MGGWYLFSIFDRDEGILHIHQLPTENELKKELANVPNIPEAIGKCKWFALI